jgi:nitrate reductase gamma subunit
MLIDFILNVKNRGVDLVYIQMEGCRVCGPVAPPQQYNESSLHVEDGRMLHVVSFVFHTSIYHIISSRCICGEANLTAAERNF